MQLYPENTLEKFEFDTVKGWIADRCISPMGKDICARLLPFSKHGTIKNHLQLTAEFKHVLEEKLEFPLDGYLPVSDFIGLLEKEGSTGDIDHFNRIRSITTAVQKLHAFTKDKEDYPLLIKMIKRVPFEKAIITLINKVLNVSGKVKDKASPELAQIRDAIFKKQRELSKVFDQAIARYRKAGHLAPTQESIRNGRRVLAVKAEYKRKIKGIIHDISETGQTAYIEPESALQLSNDLLNLEQDERTEIHRILRALTEEIRPYISLIRDYEQLLGRIDFIQAKAQLAKKLKATMPKLAEEPVAKLLTAYHPILKLQNEKSGKKTQPLNLSLDKENRILVISGPNAGGKSVALKTLGLLQLMLQSGILVPVSPKSTMGIFKKLLTEMGDEQSIENELSTYSSKLKHMGHFLKVADAKSLFLIDEFGSGTDPSLGGAVAQSILENMNARKSYGVVTTHYLNLKTYANDAEGVFNGAMLFDETTLNPMYTLEVGKPGSSYTFAIATKSGLGDKIVKRAKALSSNSQLELDDLLTNTQQSQTDILLKQLELENERLAVDRKQKDLAHLKKQLKAQKEQYTLNKKEEELRVKQAVKKQFDELVKKWEKVTNKSKAAQDIREQLKNELNTTKGFLQKKKRIKAKTATGDKKISKGASVKWIATGQIGTVETLKKKKAEVIFGNIRTLVSIADLVVVSETVKKKQARSNGNTFSKSSSLGSIDFELDIRGQRYDAAEKALQDFFDKALLSNTTWLNVLHGKGSGVLRELVASVAKQYGAKKTSHPHPEEGGDGITIVQF